MLGPKPKKENMAKEKAHDGKSLMTQVPSSHSPVQHFFIIPVFVEMIERNANVRILISNIFHVVFHSTINQFLLSSSSSTSSLSSSSSLAFLRLSFPVNKELCETSTWCEIIWFWDLTTCRTSSSRWLNETGQRMWNWKIAWCSWLCPLQFSFNCVCLYTYTYTFIQRPLRLEGPCLPFKPMLFVSLFTNVSGVRIDTEMEKGITYYSNVFCDITK